MSGWVGYLKVVFRLPERSAELVVVHVRLALALSPSAGHLVRVRQLELALSSLPRDASCIVAVR